MANYFCTDSVEEQVDYLTDKVKDLKTTKLDKAAVVQVSGTGTDVVMSQKAVSEQVQALKQADVTINESLQTINTEINGKLNKPTNPSAESAVTMLANGTVGTKLLSEIGGGSGGGKLYRHTIEFMANSFTHWCDFITYSTTNEEYTVDKLINSYINAPLFAIYHDENNNDNIGVIYIQGTKMTFRGVSVFINNTSVATEFNAINIALNYNDFSISDTVAEL